MIMAVGLFSCKKENLTYVSGNITAPVLLNPTEGSAGVVTPEDSTNKVKFTWQKADYGVNAILTYTLQMDVKGNDFSHAVTLGSSETDSLSLTLGNLNSYAINVLGQTPNTESNLIFRLSADLSGKDTVYSQTVNYKLTTYKEVAPEYLFVPGAYQGWAPDMAPKIAYKENGNYEGYINMPVGDYFKFTSAPDWNHINYGSAGAGKLSTDGQAEGLNVTSAGYYKFNVNTKDLTWSSFLVNSWGAVGSATPGSWDNSTAMTYDSSTKKWSVTLNLVPGAVKFRANNSWDLNYGPADSNTLTGTLIATDGAVTINDAGNYKIEIDFSQTTQKNYTYKITKL